MSMGLFSIYSRLGNILIKRTAASTEVDKSDLEAAISLYESEVGSSEDYTPSSWGVYSAAVSTAEDVVADEEATQLEVDNALDALDNAYNGLTPVADRNDLTNLIVYIGTNIGPEEDYTPETWGPFATALADGIAARDNLDATQQQIDDATDALNNAMVALEEVA